MNKLSPNTKLAIRDVISPNDHTLMLATSCGETFCAECVRKHLRTFVQDIKDGQFRSYRAICLAATDAEYYCEHCGECFNGYDYEFQSITDKDHCWDNYDAD
jgi:hypothetical protein